MCACEGLRSTSDVLLRHSPSYLRGQSPHWDLGLTSSAKSSEPQESSCPPFPSGRVTGTYDHRWLWVEVCMCVRACVARRMHTDGSASGQMTRHSSGGLSPLCGGRFSRVSATPRTPGYLAHELPGSSPVSASQFVVGMLRLQIGSTTAIKKKSKTN